MTEPIRQNSGEPRVSSGPVDWTGMLNRAKRPGELADVLEQTAGESGLVGALHQFLERAAEKFRQQGTGRGGAYALAFDAHAEAVRLIGDGLADAADLENDATSPRTAAARADHRAGHPALAYTAPLWQPTAAALERRSR
ncbi:hypothetical protein AB0D10_25195 [Kitasatospora sp. NPDC048545]|uniref:hypothetical protein n=1 Tax=Kitasatospora sp. NPDC048545 TaxID=3157208 RepID=UPI0033CA454A